MKNYFACLTSAVKRLRNLHSNINNAQSARESEGKSSYLTALSWHFRIVSVNQILQNTMLSILWKYFSTVHYVFQ